MFVPFIFDMNSYTPEHFLWTFYKAIDFAAKTQSVVVANEIYCKTPVTSYLREGRWEVTDDAFVNNALLYHIPEEKDWPFQRVYALPDALLTPIVAEKGAVADAYDYLLTKPDQRLVDFLKKLIERMETDTGDKIEGFLNFQASIPSLETVAAACGIPVIHWELGCWRYPTYLNTVYWDLENLYGGKSVERRWEQFSKEREVEEFPLLSKQECLALLLEKDKLYLVDEYNRRPIQRMGAALGYSTIGLISSKSKLNDAEMLYQMEKIYGLQNMLIRKHPGDPYGAQYPYYSVAMEKEDRGTPEFILDCETVTSLMSGCGMEAMLFNRKAITLFPSPSYFASGHKIGEEGVCLGEDFISFFAFCYLVPLEYMSDPDYFRWRLTMPTEREIYIRHLKFYFEKKGLSLGLINRTPGERLELMLSAQGYRPKAVLALEEKVQVLIREKQEMEERMWELEERTQNFEYYVRELEQKKQMLEEKTQNLDQDIQILEQEKQLLKEQTQSAEKEKFFLREQVKIQEEAKQIAERAEENFQREIAALNESACGWQQELAAVRASYSFRLGRAITWLPRKLRSGLRCIRENGWSYTVKHGANKLRRNL